MVVAQEVLTAVVAETELGWAGVALSETVPSAAIAAAVDAVKSEMRAYREDPELLITNRENRRDRILKCGRE